MTGKNHVEITVDDPVKSRAFYQSPWGISAAFPAVSLDTKEATLTKRKDRRSPAEPIPPATGPSPAGKTTPSFPIRRACI